MSNTDFVVEENRYAKLYVPFGPAANQKRKSIDWKRFIHPNFKTPFAHIGSDRLQAYTV